VHLLNALQSRAGSQDWTRFSRHWLYSNMRINWYESIQLACACTLEFGSLSIAAMTRLCWLSLRMLPFPRIFQALSTRVSPFSQAPLPATGRG